MSRTKMIAYSTVVGLLLLVAGGFLIDCQFTDGGGAVMFTGGFCLFAAWANAQDSDA